MSEESRQKSEQNQKSPDWDAVLAAHCTPEQCRRLTSARIGIVGAGGLGSNCAVMLVRSGIRHLILADPDTVALSNLNRQYFFPRHLGQPKVDALAEVLRELNPQLDLVTQPCALDPDSAARLFVSCDIVVEAVDDPCTKRALVEGLLLQGHVVIAASGMAGWGGSPMTARRMGRLIVVGDHQNEVSPKAPPLAPRVTMAAAMQADAVLCQLLG